MLLGLLSKPVFSQGMPVYDNTNFLALGKSLNESAKQTSQLLKTVDFLREQKQRLEQVNVILKELNLVREIIDNNGYLFEMVKGDLREILSSPYLTPEEVDRISDSFDAILEIALADMEFMRQLLMSNYLEMSDAERLMLLETQRSRSREMVEEIQVKKKRYRTIISFRRFQSRINNREITH